MTVAEGGALELVQISDCHVSADPGAVYRERNAGKGLDSLLPAISSFGPGFLLLTGDISEDASPESYRRVAGRLATLEVPVLALPGNHDIPDVMRTSFPAGPWDGPLFNEIGSWLLVLLDSTERDRIDGVIGDEHLAALRDGLSASAARHVLVALHHQPLDVGSPWIDKYALSNGDALLKLLSADGRVRCVTWGHVHQDFQAEHNGMMVLGSPSSVANGQPGGERFVADDSGPACRWLRLGSDGRVDTGLVRP